MNDHLPEALRDARWRFERARCGWQHSRGRTAGQPVALRRPPIFVIALAARSVADRTVAPPHRRWSSTTDCGAPHTGPHLQPLHWITTSCGRLATRCLCAAATPTNTDRSSAWLRGSAARRRRASASPRSMPLAAASFQFLTALANACDSCSKCSGATPVLPTENAAAAHDTGRGTRGPQNLLMARAMRIDTPRTALVNARLFAASTSMCT